ncbi:MAG: hypothetical protein MI673_04640 [Thiotrichales bacterium]|nr:hypothetical protein [Thiotrichales bacterium]
MKNLFVFLVVVCLGLTGYFIYQYSSAPDGETGSQAGPASGQAADNASANMSTDGTINEALRQEAQTYIEEISRNEPDPVTAKQADDFVSGNQVISLGVKQNIELVKPADLLALDGVSENSPITVVTEHDQIEPMDTAQILKEAGGNLNREIKVIIEDELQVTTVEKILSDHAPGDTIQVLKKVEQHEIRTPAEILADTSIDKNTGIKIIRGPYRLETTTVDELLMGQESSGSDTNIFYVRNVSDKDEQGIWGIVHNGLIDNFATGIALRRGETIRKYKIMIPRDADEMQGSSSSYLGRLIQAKTSESFVYNFKQGKMGRNPDLIYPGQEIIIIKFSTDELINIYQHFVENISS